MTLALVLAFAAAFAPCRQGDLAGDWSNDTVHFVAELERLHPDPYFGCPREEFERSVDVFFAGLAGASEQQALVEFMRLTARLSVQGREGHSAVWPMRSNYLPLRLYSFEDGWFVVGAGEQQREWIGAQVLSIGGVPIEELCARLAPLLAHDNEWNLRSKLGNALVCGDILFGIGALADPSRAQLELKRAGESHKLELALGAVNLRELFGSFPLPPRADARWLDGRDSSWRIEVLKPERALYVQFNEVVAKDSDAQSLDDFAAKIVRTFEQEKLTRVIVDVRANGGGDNTTFGPLIRALQTPALNRPGVLFGLIGRYTFSAGGNFVTVLERDTKATLVGEPTGGAPNQYGDAQSVSLPNHPTVLVRVATRFHQFGGPEDARLTHEPRLRVPLRSDDYFSGKDPVLRAALEFQLSK
jgi:hypothetical protein